MRGRSSARQSSWRPAPRSCTARPHGKSRNGALLRRRGGQVTDNHFVVLAGFSVGTPCAGLRACLALLPALAVLCRLGAQRARLGNKLLGMLRFWSFACGVKRLGPCEIGFYGFCYLRQSQVRRRL